MGKPDTMGAMLKCSFGVAPSTLMVLPVSTALLGLTLRLVELHPKEDTPRPTARSSSTARTHPES